jgi:hypothetical protein
MRWTSIASSVTGKAHSDRNEPGQDCCRSGIVGPAGNEFFIGVAADGAGSTTDGGAGAEIACEIIYALIVQTLEKEEDLSLITEQDITGWITAARNSIDDCAQEKGKDLQDYACTCLGSVAGRDHALFFQIGDGGIVVGADEDYRAVFWPEQGEYANSTSFLSDEAYLDHLNISRTGGSSDEIALFTDGLQNLVLSFSQKKPHPGFFRPVFEALKTHTTPEFFGSSRQLNSFLLHQAVSERSDDDKTLILAVRIPE